ncbi:MAG: Rrf2 family transcriptional regulator [Pseudomonadota bacterium]
MKQNSRTLLAMHTLAHMARDPDRVLTSAEIAEHAGTNAVVVRRVLGQLRNADLLTSEKGHAGGWKLARHPETISLADVYNALGDRLVASGDDLSDTNCAVQSALQERFAQLLDDAERSLVARLAETRISDLSKA